MPNRPKKPHAIDPRKLPSGRWKGRVQYWDPDTGKRKEITQTFASPREAKKWIRETEQRFKTHTRPPTDETFAAFMARWLVHHATQLRDTTAADYQIQAKKATDVLGVKRLKDLTVLDSKSSILNSWKAGYPAGVCAMCMLSVGGL